MKQLSLLLVLLLLSCASPSQPSLVHKTSLAKAVETHLSEDEVLQNAEIYIAEAGGVVKLRGAVPSSYVKNRAIRLTKQTKGVTGVDAQELLIKQ